MRKILLLAIAVLSMVPVAVSAQSAASCSVPVLPVTMTLSGDLDSTVPSTSVGFHATINNSGSETIPDAALVVDVVRADAAGNNAIVDRFVAPEHVTIFGHYSGTTDFVWKVPENLSTGIYSLVVTLASKDAPLAQVFAHVSYPTAKQGISIKDGSPFAASIQVVSVNGQVYKPLSVAQISDGGASATATIHNGSDIPYKGTITWRLYPTDARIGTAPVDERTDAVELHPNTDTQVAYRVSSPDNSAYYLEGELNNGQETTYFDVLLDNGNNSFPWAACIKGDAPANSANTNRIIAAILILLIIIGAFLAERRRLFETARR